MTCYWWLILTRILFGTISKLLQTNGPIFAFDREASLSLLVSFKLSVLLSTGSQYSIPTPPLRAAQTLTMTDANPNLNPSLTQNKYS